MNIPRKVTEAELIDWQLTALDDLRAFIIEHSQDAEMPLPAITWQVSPLDVVGSVDQYDTDPSGIRAHRPNIVTVYAEALGTEVREVYLGAGKTRYETRLRIGPENVPGGMCRTLLVVRVDVEETGE